MTRTFCDSCKLEFKDKISSWEYVGDLGSIAGLPRLPIVFDIKINSYQLTTTGMDFCPECLIKVLKTSINQ